MISLRAVLRLFAIALLLLNGYAVLFSRRGLQDLQRIKNENSALSQRLAQVKTEKETLEKKVAGIMGDPREQERAVRQTLGYVRPGEVMIEFP